MNFHDAPKCVMIITGEASGDNHGAKLVRAIREYAPDLVFYGIGGSALKAAGVRILADSRDLAVVGITEVFSKIPGILRGMGQVKKALKSLCPDLLILIDFPDFNLHAAGVAKKHGIPVLYYITPQVWAWRKGRVKKIRRRVDQAAVILPFEADFFKDHGIQAEFVGHPLMDADIPMLEPPGSGDTGQESVIGLLPGSRDREVLRHLPLMMDAARQIEERHPGTRFLISRAPSVAEDLIDTVVRENGAVSKYEVHGGKIDDVFRKSRMVIAVSGTVTLEAALFAVPMVIIYRVSPLSYWLGKALVRVDHIGLVNLISGKRLVPELVQNDASADRIAETVCSMISDPAGLQNLHGELKQTRQLLGGPGASTRVARMAISMMGSNAAAAEQ